MKPLSSRKTPQDLLKRYHPDSMARLARKTNKAGLKDPETRVYQRLSTQRCTFPERQRLIRWFNFWLDIANDSVFLQLCPYSEGSTAHFECIDSICSCSCPLLMEELWEMWPFALKHERAGALSRKCADMTECVSLSPHVERCYQKPGTRKFEALVL